MSKKEKKIEEIVEPEEIAEEQPLDEQAEQDESDGLQALRAELAEAESKAAENLDGWQRAQAEFANYKKRVARDQEQLYSDTRGRIIVRYLEIVDDLERALESCPKEGEGAEWASGIEIIYRKLLSLLENEGVTQMKIEGKTFDPNLQEAVAQEDSQEHKSGEIIEVLTPGYMLGDRVLRPAVVKVAK